MQTAVGNIKWDAGLYNDKHSFVFEYGAALIDLLKPQAGERIADVGCGTGILAQRIAESGASVIGIDASAEMIAQATAAYPRLDFRMLSVTDFQLDKPVDAIFSNATLHWVLEKEKAIECMYRNLKPTGRLVLEMGGKTNVQSILNSLKTVLREKGFGEQAERNVFYFPSLSEYTSLLENAGFRVTLAAHFDRETELSDAVDGMKTWIKMFGSAYLAGIDQQTVEEMLDEVQVMLRPAHFRNGKWWADYKRLRVVAIK